MRRLKELQTTRDALVRENSLLRERKDEYLKWESVLGQHVDRYLKPTTQLITNDDTKKRLIQSHRRWMLIHPLTLEECHAMTRSMYSEIKAFRASEQSIPLNAPVLGWAHMRQEEDGRLKFSLQKTFSNRSALELMKRSWSILSSPRSSRLYSEKLKMRCELVQQVDVSNVVQYLEFEVNGVDPRTGDAMLTISRTLAFQTIFEIESGYITTFLSLDPHKLANWPDACDPVPSQANVHFETTPGFTWTLFERSGPSGQDCKVTFVGGIRNRHTRASWAIEVLLMALRWEGLVVGPTFTLVNQDQ